MGEREPDRGLTQAELASVLRRAAELDARDDRLPAPDDRIDVAAVEDAASEVGLSRDAVRRAIDEVLHPDDTTPVVYDGGILPIRELVLTRVVPGPAAEVEDRIGRFLRRQLFEQRRVFADGSRWAPRRGWVVSLRKGLDPGGRLILKQLRGVAVTITPIDDTDDRVRVRIALDTSTVRSIHTTLLAGGAVAGAGVVGATGALVGIDPMALLALPAAGGLVAGGHYAGRWSVRREAEAIHTGVAGLLDRLEHPERAPSRRRNHPLADRGRDAKRSSGEEGGG